MKNFEPDLIITNWEMEPMNGIEFAQNVRNSGEDADPFVPIIMLSEHSTLAHVIEARDAGITEYVTKPFSAKSLISRIQTVINTPRPFVRTKVFWFFDVSNGIEEVSERGGDQVDHGDVGGGVSVSACLCPSGLEETVEALHAGVAVA